MIPTTPYSTEYQTVSAKNQTSRTYRLDAANGRISGYVDGVEAVKQAIILILNTERFSHAIYSWNYGSEANNVIGEDFDVAESEVKRYIKEALLQDERITDVDEFTFERSERNTLNVSFTVRTIFGDIENEIEVRT